MSRLFDFDPHEPQGLSRSIAWLLLISLTGGVFGEMYAPSQVFYSQSPFTAEVFKSGEQLFRFGFVGYLAEATSDLLICLLFYFLLKPVNKPMAAASALFGMVSMLLFAVAKMFYLAAPSFLLASAHFDAFSSAQRSALSLHFAGLYGLLSAVPLLFYGIASLLRGILIYRSEYLPKILGVALALAGLGFVIRSLTQIAAPNHSHPLLLAPMLLAMLVMMLWLGLRGVNTAKWAARSATVQR